MSRIYNLDYLRGLAALGIMVYHYLSWTLGDFESDTILGRIGIYGVSIFYILSGLTLFHVYFHRMKPDFGDLKTFYKKRALRIFPLLWLVVIATILIFSLSPEWTDVMLVLSGLFGIFKWDYYIATGAWSIGNELVFYLFFPVFIYLLKRTKIGTSIMITLVTLVFLYFAFYGYDTSKTLSDYWSNYINPLNQLFLFMSGILIGINFESLNRSSKIFGLVLLTGILIFVLYPAEGNQINIVSGFNRLVFTFACVLICLSLYKLNLTLPKFVHKPLVLLGEASYSVYLIHPIIYAVVGFSNDYIESQGINRFSETYRLLLSFFSTLLVSYFVYQYFEKYFMRLGKSTQVMRKEMEIKTTN
jgi:exopolysaccharide production protein ExoZ